MLLFAAVEEFLDVFFGNCFLWTTLGIFPVFPSSFTNASNTLFASVTA